VPSDVGPAGQPGGFAGWAQPKLIRRGNAALRRTAPKFLDDGEKLLFALSGRTVPLQGVDGRLDAYRQLPGMLSGKDRQLIVLRTDRAIRLMKTRVFSVWRPKKELERFPLETPVAVELNADDSGGILDVGSHRLYFGAHAVDDAEAVATDVHRDSGPHWRKLLSPPP
jgi:hypothetical protein